MPIYQYECRSCNQNFEQRQSFNDNPLTDCPLCGTEGSVNRIISQVGVIFKGSGFYITDSKNNGRSNGTKSSTKSDSSDSSSTSEAKASDSKSSDSKVAETT